jgi:hypothetical protein
MIYVFITYTDNDLHAHHFNKFADNSIVTTTNVTFWFLVVCFSGVEGGELIKQWRLSYLYHKFILNSMMLN